MIKKYIDDPNKIWEERYKALETHHLNETEYLINILDDVYGYVSSTAGDPYLKELVRLRLKSKLDDLFKIIK